MYKEVIPSTSDNCIYKYIKIGGITVSLEGTAIRSIHGTEEYMKSWITREGYGFTWVDCEKTLCQEAQRHLLKFEYSLARALAGEVDIDPLPLDGWGEINVSIRKGGDYDDRHNYKFWRYSDELVVGIAF